MKIKKAAGNNTCDNNPCVFSYDGIIRIRSQVEVIVKNGLPLSLSFIKLPKLQDRL